MITIEFMNRKDPLEIQAYGFAKAVQMAVKNKADLSKANLNGANLSNTDLRCADLNDADLSNTDLRGANLRGANLNGANLHYADLRGADLCGADLRFADLRGTELHEADLRGATLDFASWPLRCGSLNVKIDKRIFCQLLYHTLRAGQSVEDPEIASLLRNTEVLNLANEFHRVDECGKINDENERRVNP